MEHRILLVDDEPNILSALKRMLRRGAEEGLWSSLKVESFSEPRAALARAMECRFSLVISDYRMPGMSGAELLGALREVQPECRRVILSGQTDYDGLMSAINQAQIVRFMPKPWVERELLFVIRQLLIAHEMVMENLALADLQRLAQGRLNPQEMERRRLERLELGLTRMECSSDGAPVLDAPAARP
jgi:two-component system probable response regulator PhcQ